jgi:hypothetical protein
MIRAQNLFREVRRGRLQQGGTEWERALTLLSRDDQEAEEEEGDSDRPHTRLARLRAQVAPGGDYDTIAPVLIPSCVRKYLIHCEGLVGHKRNGATVKVTAPGEAFIARDKGKHPLTTSPDHELTRIQTPSDCMPRFCIIIFSRFVLLNSFTMDAASQGMFDGIEACVGRCVLSAPRLSSH